MNEKINDGGPAFPCHPEIIPQKERDFAGMTLRQYAAIKLRVPNSGTDWLDEMIRESMRNELAAKAMQGSIAHSQSEEWSCSVIAEDAYMQADAMLKASDVVAQAKPAEEAEHG